MILIYILKSIQLKKVSYNELQKSHILVTSREAWNQHSGFYCGMRAYRETPTQGEYVQARTRVELKSNTKQIITICKSVFTTADSIVLSANTVLLTADTLSHTASTSHPDFLHKTTTTDPNNIFQ